MLSYFQHQIEETISASLNDTNMPRNRFVLIYILGKCQNEVIAGVPLAPSNNQLRFAGGLRVSGKYLLNSSCRQKRYRCPLKSCRQKFPSSHSYPTIFEKSIYPRAYRTIRKASHYMP
jgi:hypothetical protein